jgi:hypothetical protein
MDKVAEALVWQRIERKARASLLGTLTQAYGVPPDVVESAMKNLRHDLKIDEYARRDWSTEEQQKFSGQLLAQLQHAVDVRRPRQ